MRAKKYIRYLVPTALFGTQRTKKIVNVNPTIEASREDAKESTITVYNYNERDLAEDKLQTVNDSFAYHKSNRISWINIDGLIKSEVESIATHFGIHPLLTEDILSMNQRPKMDEVEGIFYCLLNMIAGAA